MPDHVVCPVFIFFLDRFRWGGDRGGLLHSEVRHDGTKGLGRRYSLAGLVSQTASSALVLAAAEDVPDQTLAVEERLGRRWESWFARLGGDAGIVAGRGGVVERTEAGLDQGEAAADPVAVAAVDALVGAAGEAGFRGVLARGEPGDEAGEVEVSGDVSATAGAADLRLGTEVPCSSPPFGVV